MKETATFDMQKRACEHTKRIADKAYAIVGELDVNISSRAQRLFSTLKQFLVESGLNDLCTGGMFSYELILMVAKQTTVEPFVIEDPLRENHNMGWSCFGLRQVQVVRCG